MTKTALIGFLQNKMIELHADCESDMAIYVTPTPDITRIFEEYIKNFNTKNVAVSFSLEDHKTYYGLYKEVNIDFPDTEDDEEDKYYEIEYEYEETQAMEENRQCQNRYCMINLECNQSIHNKDYCGWCAPKFVNAPCECVVGDEMKDCDHKKEEEDETEGFEEVYDRSIWNDDKDTEYNGWTYYMCWGGGPVGGYLTNGKRVVMYDFTLDKGRTFEELRNKIVVEDTFNSIDYVRIDDAPKRKKPTIGRICSA